MAVSIRGRAGRYKTTHVSATKITNKVVKAKKIKSKQTKIGVAPLASGGLSGGYTTNNTDTISTSAQNLSQVVVTNLTLGGKNLQYSSGNYSPQCVTSLSCRWEMGVATECSFTLYHHVDPYDQSGSSLSTNVYEIPLLLQNAYNNQTVGYTFNYGYNWVGEGGYNALMTPLYGLTITDCTFRMYQSGIEYTIKGVSFGAVNTILQGEFTYNWAKDKKGLVGGDIGSKVSSSKLVARICSVIEKIFSMSGYGTQWLGRKPTNYSSLKGQDFADEALSVLNEGNDSETMMVFAKELLSRLQLKESNNVYYSNYEIQFRDYANEPYIIIYPTTKYVYEGKQWVQYPAYNYGGNSYIWNGNPNLDTTGVGSNSIISTTLTYPVLPTALIGSTSIKDDKGNELNTGASINGTYSTSPDTSFALATNDFYNIAYGLPIEGSITIPGTTKEFLPNEVINIEIYVANQLFATSGRYLVLTKTDKISGGRFETTLEVLRIAESLGTWSGGLGTSQTVRVNDKAVGRPNKYNGISNKIK